MTEKNYTIQHFDEMMIQGYPAQLPLPTMENIEEVSKAKSNHFASVAKSGKFPMLMKVSQDKIGYAISTATADFLEYFAGANTIENFEDTETRTLPEGDYVVLKGEGGPSRALFDQLISKFFGEILPANPGLYKEDSFVVEALLNGNPMDAVVELRIPVSENN
ncbi:hypothetical protein D920_03135 [Enterococcus faecalis 13-SD-W-01]|nr:hypothetical protein D920_03135 [Enterococcus faecalis 13-SD-W-01]